MSRWERVKRSWRGGGEPGPVPEWLEMLVTALMITALVSTLALFARMTVFAPPLRPVASRGGR